MALPAAAFELTTDVRSNIVDRTMMRQPWSPQMDARTVRPRFHRFITKVPGHDLLGQLRPPCASKTHQIFGRNRDHARVSATARGTGQAIELGGILGHGVGALTSSASCCQIRRGALRYGPRWV